ncbi:Mini-ribonuclease 3 [Pseudolactococcus paracarnosus]|uniref:Mini-ribonuclease 3 n=1 Tax=Pseudolactococcus paracarnosus TaxID=2749962 RepID=A0A7L4WEB2_9LACT|nr:Mini-ribonuclease 3 [Lactococcus paracarnosus]SPC38222.1 ribonuclease for 23S RNA maturation, mini-RNase III [Lactococcus piscium]MCJ1978354.1 Mini-ribonuclease 3 [Lactococcus paracarnosus]MCJ1984492.1 Mini-ribonuclease 3 [Lactococcus paracarnosus]MCJ1993860.1 Mini-ribonuclease 3 [Lactococcus paracarnosus]MCJ1998950.1 Mini-ribonuclease 3 [Lactococcus paracarnosus]
MTEFRADLLNGIALAYAGDAVYEVFVRDHLLAKGITKPGELQKNAVRFVSAKAQAYLIAEMEKDAFLTEEELSYFKRGRNAHSKTTAKNTDVITYRISTGFEAVFGFNHLTGKNERVAELATYCIKKISEQIL